MHPFFGDRCRFGRGAWLIVLPCVWLGVGAGQTSPLARISHQLLKNAEPMSSKGALMRASKATVRILEFSASPWSRVHDTCGLELRPR